MNTKCVALAAAALLVLSSADAGAQDRPPTITTRMFTSGTAKVTVTGSFSFTEEIPINVSASFGSGKMTWVQFGASGSAEPNATVTYSAYETGIIVARGKLVATGGIMVGEKSECTGKADVTATLISARYTCPGLTSHDPATGKMGKVDVEITFTAKS